MIDRVDQLALSTDDEHIPERFAYKYVALSQDDGWVNGMTVETLLSPVDEEAFTDDAFNSDPVDRKETNGKDAKNEPEDGENSEDDVEVAQADSATPARKTADIKKAVTHHESSPANNAHSSSEQNAGDEKVIGSGAPIDFTQPDPSFDFLDVNSGSYEGFSQPDSLLNIEGFSQQDLQPNTMSLSTLPDTATEDAPLVQVSQSVQATPTITQTANNSDQPVENNEDSSTVLVDTNIDAATLNQMIAAADAGTTFLLADGVHIFDQCILITRSDVTLKGESENGTILQFDFTDGPITDTIKIIGGAKKYTGSADSGATAGDNSLVIENNDLKAGDNLYIFQPNTREWLDANGWQNVSMEDADHRPFREVIAEVDHVEGDVVYFTHSLPYSMDEGAVKLNSIDLLENIIVSDFTVTYNLGTPDAHDFTNTMPDYEGTAAISIVGTTGLEVERISITDFASKGLVIGTSIDAQVDDIYVSGSHNKGGDGNGYGVLLFESNHASLTNMEIFDTRHGFTTSAWSAETDNIIHILNTNRDTGFLGSPDHGNVVTVDNAILDFNAPFFGNGGDSWSMVSAGGSNHAYVDAFANNEFNFGHGEGSNRNDVITAGDNGSYLNGKYGYDTLIGGAGDDYLVGGTLSDKLTGGAGSDTFLLRVGDGLDVISDFQFGDGGDQLVISNQPLVDDFSDLYIYADGSDAKIVYGRNSTVILQDVDVADINAANFSFDPAGDITAANYFASDFETA